MRFLLDGRSHVAVLGEQPLPPPSDSNILAIIEQGSEPATLPEEVAKHLRQRRRQFKSTGLDYLERRTSGDGGGA